MLRVVAPGCVEFVKNGHHANFFNTGKVRIGIAHTPKPRPIVSGNELGWQAALLHNPLSRVRGRPL